MRGQASALSSQIEIERRLRLHAFPLIGSRPLDSFRPQHIRELLGALEASSISSSYARSIYSDVRAVLSAAVDDELLPRNPCAVKRPDPKRSRAFGPRCEAPGRCPRDPPRRPDRGGQGLRGRPRRAKAGAPAPHTAGGSRDDGRSAARW
ncbi:MULTISPECIES: hypothetical protein [Streptomyces]|uniref:hypothetical protein n=1 Tax=Streptomyces TaxID=1883 RepID=UPI003570A1C1